MQNRADRTVSDLLQLSTQLRRASRGQNIDAQLVQDLINSAEQVQQLATNLRRYIFLIKFIIFIKFWKNFDHFRRTERLINRGQLEETQLGFSCGVAREGRVGRPRINILRSQLEFLLSLGFTPTSMARNQLFGPHIHRNTIQNRMRQWNLSVNF